MIITHSCTGDEYQRLLTTGVPTEAFLPEGSRMNLKYRVRDIDHTNQYSRKKISAEQQLSDFQQFLEEPTKPDQGFKVDYREILCSQQRMKAGYQSKLLKLTEILSD